MRMPPMLAGAPAGESWNRHAQAEHAAMDSCCSATPSAGPLYVQLCVAGLTWVALHCAGMCGPIVGSLGFAADGWARGAARLGLYQLGRAVPLAAAGAIAGWLGDELSGVLGAWMAWAVLGVAVGLIAAAVVQIGWLPWFRSGSTLAVRLVRPVAGWAARHPLGGAGLLGLVLSLLPCGVVYWALTLAAISSNPWDGAALMALLVAFTTIPLAVAAAVGGLAWGGLRRRWGRWVPPAALIFSAIWMGLHAAAMLGWIPHAHIGRLMLW
jgi:sulfite exporter TauE/SafE